jgi:hypothetical protein
MAFLDENLESIEIYPKIIVYKNVFNNIDGIYSMLKNLDQEDNDSVLSKWSQWSIFGEYLNPVVPNNHTIFMSSLDGIEATTDKQKEQKDFVVQLITNFNRVTKDYAERHGLDTFNNPMPTSRTREGGHVPTWQQSGPTVCKYTIDPELEQSERMTYHSDYIREKQHAPGYKFAFTALAYFNDDYQGGELDFVIGNKMFKYKPVAGDYIVFPSGHPEILTEDGSVYLHGVMASEGTAKYFSRMYWQQYYPGSYEWFEEEAKHGKEVWEAMQPELEEAFRQKHPQRYEIQGGVRIQ